MGDPASVGHPLTERRDLAGRVHSGGGQRREEVGADGTQRVYSVWYRGQRGRDRGKIGRLGRVGGAQGADGVGVGEHVVMTAAIAVRFH